MKEHSNFVLFLFFMGTILSFVGFIMGIIEFQFLNHFMIFMSPYFFSILFFGFGFCIYYLRKILVRNEESKELYKRENQELKKKIYKILRELELLNEKFTNEK